MEKLMKNNMMKFVVCAGFFCGTNFGMEKEQIIPSAVHNKFYVEYKNAFYSINQDGSRSQVEDLTESIIRSSQKFKDGRLVDFKNQKCYVEGDSAYGFNVASKKGEKTDPRVGLERFCFISVQCTNDQLKEVIRLMDARRGIPVPGEDGVVHYKHKQEYSPFVLDEYNFRVDIESTVHEVEWMVEAMIDNAAKKEVDNSELSKE